MTRVTHGIRSDEGEIDRWAVTRGNATASAEARLSRWEPYPGTVRLTLFADSDAEGTERIGMNLDPEHVRGLIADLQDVLSLTEGHS